MMLLFVDSITNMTMSDDILEHFAVCPRVADETDAGMEAPATGLAPDVFLWRRWIVELPSGGRPCESCFARLVCQMLRFPMW